MLAELVEKSLDICPKPAMIRHMNANTIKKLAKDWYFIGRNFLPELSDLRFAEIAGKSHAFVYEVIGEKLPIYLTVDPTTDTAYADLRNRKIAISSKYFDPSLYSERYGEEGKDYVEGLAIALINGSIIHEALHFSLTAEHGGTGDMIEDVQRSRRGLEALEKYGVALTTAIFNIVEDIYIEHNVPDNLADWLQATSDILFSVEDLEHDWDVENPNDFVALVCAWKNKANRDHKAFRLLSEEQLWILKKVAVEVAPENDRVRWRVERAIDLLETLKLDEGEGEDEGESGEGESSESKSGEGESGEGGSSGKGESGSGSESSGSEGQQTMGEKFSKAASKVEGLSEARKEAIAKEVEEASKAVSDEKAEVKTYGEDWLTVSWKKMVEEDIMDNNREPRYPPIEPATKIDFTFLRNLQAIRTMNRTPGQARKNGSVMVKSRLTRIATDGKIFAKNDSTRKTLKRVEVIINIDFSGSTSGGGIIENELGSAMAMSKTLRAARIPHSVYGHTSKGSGQTPYLFHIYSYEMHTTNNNWEARFKKATEMHLSQNLDGVIIERLGQKFTKRAASKFLINLSDGEPAAPGYSGRLANEHTQKAIESLRKSGIGVFAISVVDGVVKSNNEIYGKDFNIDGSRDTNAQFQKLIERIARG